VDGRLLLVGFGNSGSHLLAGVAPEGALAELPLLVVGLPVEKVGIFLADADSLGEVQEGDGGLLPPPVVAEVARLVRVVSSPLLPAETDDFAGVGDSALFRLPASPSALRDFEAEMDGLGGVVVRVLLRQLMGSVQSASLMVVGDGQLRRLQSL
jgi:hypothetical protein